MPDFDEDGFAVVDTAVSAAMRATLRESVFEEGSAGKRCLLDHPAVEETAHVLCEELVQSGHLPTGSVAIQAIAFDKSPTTNWKVAWHQDLMFPVAREAISEDYKLPSLKDGIHFARPPATVLAELLAVRLHLDDCDWDNGPLRVSPGTHRLGVLPAADISDLVKAHGETTCLAREGEALLMRPLLLHASSQAATPKHRRVLHYVFHSGAPVAEPWHRAI
jgi:ectoine hydroxylase-related dioxygenase (phytanoyl-CoA dioxygenase family)